MKNIFLSAFLALSFNTINAQNHTPSSYQSSYSSTYSVNSLGGDHAVFGVKSENAGKSLKYDEIVGSPYFDANFAPAKVAENYEKTSVRYNSYTDEVEFQKDGKPLTLPKDAKFSRIEIASPKKATLALLETKDDLSGYFFELVNGKNSLYKKIKTKFIDMVPAQNSYATDRPASFKTLEPIYYIKTEKGFIKKAKNLKDLTEQFPDKKEAIEGFVKSNKIKFNNEADLIKLVTFLNQ